MDQYPSNRASQIIWAPILRLDRFIDDPELNKNIVDLSQYYEDLKNGTLPQVAYIVPSGPSEHPPSNIQSGMRFVKTLIQMLTQSDYWEKSAFLLVYDDWGGWYDHVLPPKVDDYGYGMDIITAAMGRSTKPDIRYIDGILRRWRDQGYTTLAEVEAERQQKSGPAAASAPTGAPADSDTLKREEWLDQMDQQAAEAIWRLYDENNNDQSE